MKYDRYAFWLLIAVVILGTSWIVSPTGFRKSSVDPLGRGNFANITAVAGSSSNFVSVPRTAVFANTTTTDSANSFGAGVQVGFLDGGSTITQFFSTDGYDQVQLELAAVGGTATSTLFARLQLYDGTDWSDITASTTAAGFTNATGTLISTFSPTGFQYDPGTASTSLMRYPFYVYGSKQGRIILYADDLLSDPNDGVQIWAKVVGIDPFQR